ncbi:IS3 family transposase [Leuconostoc mesenteroides]|uniref:IS3 family transposase n=3 Tax=Leuconostoc mesenteroides TaxID=1245 RepID=UPI00236115C9|nr:IS3 family transposase [Leuconostoc mesenteroides]
MKAKRYSTEFKSSIVTLYNEGRSANSLANEYHLAVQTVTGWVKNLKSIPTALILKIVHFFSIRAVQEELIKLDIHLSDAVVRRLMDELNVQVSLYNRHRNGRYSSYKGTVGKVARNVLHQHFNETVPFKVLHTDVTQVRLADTKWAYVSAITDEASKEVLAFQVSNSPNSKLIMDTLDELTENIPEGIKPIIHSDQGWHYQLNYYTDKLSEKKFIQSMSRKGNCLDNAPIESFFHLLKTECLNGFPQCKDIGEFKEITKNYVDWFNNRRISQGTCLSSLKIFNFV